MRYFTIEQREILRTILLQSQQPEERTAEALAKLRSPEFGICDECEGDITFRFLQEHPFTTLCRRCKQRNDLAPFVPAIEHKKKETGA